MLWPTGLTVLFMMCLNPSRSLMQNKKVSSVLIIPFTLLSLVDVGLRDVTIGSFGNLELEVCLLKKKIPLK